MSVAQIQYEDHPAVEDSTTDGQANPGTHVHGGVGSDQRISGHRPCGDQSPPAADALVLIAADVLDDLERTRVATENRLRSLTHEPVDGERGGWFGKGLDPEMLEVRRVEAILDGLRTLEHQAELDLRRAMRAHPLGGWVKRTVGVGEKQAARLLAAIGDPGARATVSQLWAYCGYHVLPGQGAIEAQLTCAGDPTDQGRLESQCTRVGGGSFGDHPGHSGPETQLRRAGVAPKRRRGMKANWSSTAKMRAFLVAESCIKQMHSPYRAVYDAGRAKYAEAIHAHPCERCGPAGHPAPAGAALSDGHKHARAMRLVAKAILRDLWIEARRTKQPARFAEVAS